MTTIESSNIRWQSGAVSLEEYKSDNGGLYWVLCDQGSPVADINCFNENHSLADALGIAQSYLEETYK